MLGDKLKQLRKNKNISQKKLGELLNLSQSAIGMIESNKNGASAEKLKEIADYFGVSVDFLIKDENKKEDFETIDISTQFIPVPIVGVIRAGQPILAEDNIQGYIPVLKNSLKLDAEYFALKVKGDSMNLEFNEGTTLIVEKTPCIENGEIGVVRIDGLEATVKKVVLNNDMITLIPMSTNPIHIPQMYNIAADDIEIIGKVKHAMKSY